MGSIDLIRLLHGTTGTVKHTSSIVCFNLRNPKLQGKHAMFPPAIFRRSPSASGPRQGGERGTRDKVGRYLRVMSTGVTVDGR